MLHRLGLSLGIPLLVAVTACSGAEESDLFGPEPSGGASAAPGSSTDPTTPEPADGSGSSSPDGTDEPAPSPSDPGTAPAPGAPKPVCAAESLDNDELRKADEFDACIAGKLIGKEVDYVSTVAPANAKQVFIKHTESGGKVAYRMFVNGFSASFTDTVPDEIPAVPNAKYTFKLEPTGGTIGDRDWQLEVTFQ